MPLTVNVPALSVQPPPLSVTDAQMVTALEGEGYTVTTPVTPPPPTGKPAVYWFHASPDACPVTQVGALDYAYDANGSHSNSYTSSAAQGYTNQKLALMLKVGALNPGEPTEIGNALVAGGQAKAIIPIMWENNQDVNGWFNGWNELAFTAAAFKTRFAAICAEFDKVAGQAFTYAWNPNVNNVGNQASGRNQLDTMPAARPNLVLLLDGYDNQSGQGTANVATQSDPFVNACATAGIPFWGYAEWGPNGWDDPTYVTNMLAYLKAKSARINCLFSLTASNLNSRLSEFPNMLAAYKAGA